MYLITQSHSGCQSFLNKIRMKSGCCGLIPGKAMRRKTVRGLAGVLRPKVAVAPGRGQTRQTLDVICGCGALRDGSVLVEMVGASRDYYCHRPGLQATQHNVLGAYDPLTLEAITVTNDTDINQWVFCVFRDKIVEDYAGTGRPITLSRDNARYQKYLPVAGKAKELGIKLLYLPPYSPNLNLIERLWRFVKKQVLYKYPLCQLRRLQDQH